MLCNLSMEADNYVKNRCNTAFFTKKGIPRSGEFLFGHMVLQIYLPQWCLTNGISRNSITNPVPNAAPKLMLIHTSGCLQSGYFVIFTLYLDQRISSPRLFRFIQRLIRRHDQIVD